MQFRSTGLTQAQVYMHYKTPPLETRSDPRSERSRKKQAKKRDRSSASMSSISSAQIAEYPRIETTPVPNDGIPFLDLMIFKTMPCKITQPHNSKKCLYYHDANKRDRRRVPAFYTSEMCPNIQGGKRDCPQGDACIRAHNRIEDFYHPEKYKSKFCQSYPDKIDLCEYGSMCAFAHAESELSVNILERLERDVDFYMFHFKTAWCPFSDKEHQRD